MTAVMVSEPTVGAKTVKTSLPGLTRQSIFFNKNFLRRWMDARIKSGHDECVCVHTNLNFKQQHSCSHNFAISPRISASFILHVAPSDIRGRRECRAPDAPAAARVV